MKKSYIGLFKKDLGIFPGVKENARFAESIVLHKRVIPWKSGFSNDKRFILDRNLFLDLSIHGYESDVQVYVFVAKFFIAFF